jgi:electron transport complex protein RnfE
VKWGGQFARGLVRRNPVFVLLLGLCPTLAVTTGVENALYMGMAAGAVLLGSNLIISLIRKAIPAEIRIPCYIVVIATFVTLVEMGMKALFEPAVSERLSIFIPLIVVNCIILARAEAFASRRGVVASLLDAVGMGLGFTGALVLIAGVREFAGTGKLLGLTVVPGFQPGGAVEPAAVMIMAPGAFLVMGLLLGAFNAIGARRKTPGGTA